MKNQEYIKDFFHFLEASPTAYHAVNECAGILNENGYTLLNECENWILTPGGKYYVIRNGSSLIAFTLPENLDKPHFQIVASHSDSPCFKLKPCCEEKAAGHYVRLNVEKYGGMIMSTWMDRPLSIAGRVVVKTQDGLETSLFDAGRDLVVIPNLAIHFNRDVNEKSSFNAQKDMLPILAEGDEKGIMDKLLSTKGKVVAADLYLYNRMGGTTWGIDNEFFSAPRIDNLECAYFSLMSLISAQGSRHINMCAIFDNEEVGSRTMQGADSTFLSDTVSRILQNREDMASAVASSFMISADNAHAVHPNYSDRYDEDNRAFMNEGVVIKYNAGQKYTSNAVSSAVFSEICKAAGSKVQYFTNRSDIPGGSTLGNITNAHVSVNTVDIGLAQLAMHSAYETAGVRDPKHLKKALIAFYETEIDVLSNGKIQLR